MTQRALPGRVTPAGVRAGIVARKRRNGRGAKAPQEGGYVTTRPMEHEPAPVVPEGPKQAGVRSRWSWAAPEVWTERMLSALEDGVKGRVWFSLMDKVYAERSLRSAWAKVRGNGGSGGVDCETIARFDRVADDRLAGLGQALRDGTYRPLPVRRVYIPKPDGRERPLGIPAVRDRVVQTALRNVLEPIFEREFSDTSYGFRPGRSAKDALRRVDELLSAGYTVVVDADLKSYFDTIDHEKLMALVEARVADGKVLALLRSFLTQGVLDGMREWMPTCGSPQGAVISPLLANLYLHPLDVQLGQAGYELVRYADDFVVMCRTQGEAQAALGLIRDWVGAMDLQLHPDKTRIVDVRQARASFEFLGYRFERGFRGPRTSSLKKLKDAVRLHTPRTSGHSLAVIIGRLNPILRGWFGYFKHSRRSILSKLDGWIRMRLRSILRKRHHRKGRGRGRDHHRWPNVFFVSRGLFTFDEAHRFARQSLTVH